MCKIDEQSLQTSETELKKFFGSSEEFVGPCHPQILRNTRFLLLLLLHANPDTAVTILALVHFKVGTI